jgi:hypothetical protein
VASPSIDDLLAAIKAVAELQKDMITLQESVAKHAKVLERLAGSLKLIGERLVRLEARE